MCETEIALRLELIAAKAKQLVLYVEDHRRRWDGELGAGIHDIKTQIEAINRLMQESGRGM